MRTSLCLVRFSRLNRSGIWCAAGIGKLREVTSELGDFPVVAIGGITLENVGACFEAGASGVAAIRLLNDAETNVVDR